MATETFDFRAWMRTQRGAYVADFTDEDHIRLETDYAQAQVNFYAMDPDPEICEFHIENKADGETKFFLHFHPTEAEHARGLFREMVETLVSLRDQQTTEVLLCCTAGLTTSFFADRMNQVTEALGLDWSFSAVSVNEVFEHGADKAAILVAPQIAYQQPRIAEVMREIPVLAIPTQLFATYDAAGCVEFVRHELQERARKEAERTQGHMSCKEGSGKRVLAIAASVDGKGATIDYRLYRQGQVTVSEKVIKRRLTVTDLTDIIDTQVCSCSGRLAADVVGIAVPGIVHDGVIELPPTRSNDLTFGEASFDIEAYFRDRYDVPVVFCNNSNCAVLGWYGSQDTYKDVVLYSQPVGWASGGQGIIVDGRLHEGAHGLAGENKYAVHQLNFSHPLHFNAYDPKDVLEIVGKVLAIDVAVLDPEVICLRCDLLPDMDEVSRELAKYVPRDRQPDLVRIDDFNEHILLGVMLYSIKRTKADG